MILVVLIAICLPAVGSSSVTYRGCYVDNNGARDLPLAAYSSDFVNSIAFCADMCRRLQYSYMGLQYGSYCFCGNAYGSLGAATESDCSMPCTGNSSEMCGGTIRNSIYAISNDTTTNNAAIVGNTFTYMGCYVDSVVRDLPNVVYVNNVYNSVALCTSTCFSLNFTYAVMQFQSYCLCGNTYGSQGAAAESDCNMQCTGSNETCGAASRNSIYRVNPLGTGARARKLESKSCALGRLECSVLTSTCFPPTILLHLAMNGTWTTWSSWGTCSVTSGQGVKTRTRTCTNPAPAHGGLPCPATDQPIQQKHCNGLSILDPQSDFFSVSLNGGLTRLSSYVLMVQTTRGLIDCALSCKTMTTCMSFNFERQLGNANCELNSQTHFDDPSSLLSASGQWQYPYRL